MARPLPLAFVTFASGAFVTRFETSVYRADASRPIMPYPVFRMSDGRRAHQLRHASGAEQQDGWASFVRNAEPRARVDVGIEGEDTDGNPVVRKRALRWKGRYFSLDDGASPRH